MKKIYRVTSIFLVFLAVFASSYFAGINSGNKDEIIYNNSDEIALVNVDEGIQNDNGKRNYSNELIFLDDKKYTKASLNEARAGVASGKFAAYILIPPTFSKEIESINQKPQKPIVYYSTSDKLSSSKELEVTEKLNEFHETADYNVSFAYVEAILSDVHTIQDGSKTILKNDNIEKDRINKIDVKELIQELKKPELDKIEDKVEKLDLSTDLDKNEQIAKDYEKTLTQSMEKVKQELKKTEKDKKNVEISLVLLKDEIQNYNPVVDSVSGNYVFEKGLVHLDAKIGKYNFDTGNIITSRINTIRPKIDEISMLVAENAVSISQDKAEIIVNDEMSKYLDVVKEAYEKQVEEQLSANGITQEISLSDLASAPYSDALNTSLQDAFKVTSKSVCDFNLPNDYNTIFREVLTVSTNDIHDTIQNEIVGSIISENNYRLNRYSEASDVTINMMNQYEDKISDFDIFDYFDKKDTNNAVKQLKDNSNSIEKTINLKKEEYEKQAELFESLYSENENTMLSSIEDTNETTTKNITAMITELKANRDKINVTNSKILEEFNEKLEYTRLGSQGKRSAYDFIVDPVVFKQEITKSDARGMSSKFYLYGSILSCILAVIFFLLSVSWKKSDLPEESN